jgi:hypothetical protein
VQTSAVKSAVAGAEFAMTDTAAAQQAAAVDWIDAYSGRRMQGI